MTLRVVTSLAIFGTFAGIAYLSPATPLAAADTKQEAALKKQIVELQQDLQKATRMINDLKQDIVQGNAKVNQLQADLKKAKGDDLKDDLARANTKINQLQAELAKAKSDDTNDNKTLKNLATLLEGMKTARYVHTLNYQLKSTSSTGEVQTMLDDVTNLLSKVKVVKGIWAGKTLVGDKVSSDRLAVVILFADAADYKIFANDPQTKKFVDKHGKLWESPATVDFQVPFK